MNTHSMNTHNMNTRNMNTHTFNKVFYIMSIHIRVLSWALIFILRLKLKEVRFF